MQEVVPSAVFCGAASPALVEMYVRELSEDGLAAVELLGELPSEEVHGRPSVRIPKEFPVPEEDLESFYLQAERIGLMHPIGSNEHGVDRQVWELNLEVYGQILSAMTDLGRVSPRVDEMPPKEGGQSDADDEMEVEAPSSSNDLVEDLAQLREQLGVAHSYRAAKTAESIELRRQYTVTVNAIGETVKAITDMRAWLRTLHATRVSLKGRVKISNVESMNACHDAKALARRIAKSERATIESVAVTAAELLRAEAARSGISVNQLISEIRRKL